MAAEGRWTIDELSAMVAEALVDYPGPPSGRVREVPDRRTIRWYTTIGLLDRPSAQRGRTALYSRRHLLQLVAIKRMQADGLSLTAIQEQLYGATDRTLTRIARVTSNGDSPVANALAATPAPTGADTRAPGRFWAVPVPDRPVPHVVSGIRLDDSVTLVLPPGARVPDADDLAAVQDAAGPLLALLRQRGLAATGRDCP